MNENEITYDIVAYTDGSAQPNPGMSGYGVHMYIYNNDIKNKPKKVLGKYTVTNRGYVNNPLFKTNTDESIIEVPIYKIIDIYGYEHKCNTNNTAELYALCNLLRVVTNPIYENVFNTINTITINIDSTYVIEGVTKVLNGIDVIRNVNANKEIFLEIQEVINIAKSKNIEIILSKVKGHSNDFGNDNADMLADMGRLLRNKKDNNNIKVIIEDRVDYYGNRVERDPMLSSPLLFNYNISNSNKKDNNYYCMINYKDEIDIGKPNHKTVYSILYSETVYQELIDLSKLSDRLIDNVKSPTVLLLNNYYNKEVYNNIRLYDMDYVNCTNRISKKLSTIDNVNIVKEIYPVGISYKAFNINEELISYFDLFRMNESPNNHIIIDITDQYFITDDRGKTTLNPMMVNDKYNVKIDVKPYTGYGRKLKIDTGLDIIKRNPLKRLEKDNVSVKLILIKYKTYFKYFTIVTTNKDDNTKHLLTCNYYANVVYI